MAIRIERGSNAGGSGTGQIIGSGLSAAAARSMQEKQMALQALGQISSQWRPGSTGGGGGGGGGGGSRGGGSNAAAMQAARLTNARQMQGQEIQAAADEQQRSADIAVAKTATQFGLDQYIQEQEFENTLAQKHEEALIEANQWEVKYSMEQRQQFARNQTVKQRAAVNENFSPEERAEIARRVDLDSYNMQPGVVPADLNKPKFEEGKPANSTYLTENGTEMQVMPDGTHKMITRRDQDPNILAERAERENKWKVEDARMSAYEKFASGTITKDGLTSTPNAKQVSDFMAGWDRERAFMESQSQPQPQPQPLQQDVATRPAVTMTKENADAIYESLRPGDEYIGPDGNRYRKPGLLPQEPIPLQGFIQ